MSTIVTRAGKGSALTHVEADANFTNLNTDKIEATTSVTLTNKTLNLTNNTLTGTTAEFNAALSDANFATGGGTATGSNTGDQTSIVGITGTIAQFNTALSDGDFSTSASSETLTNKTIALGSNTVSGTTAQFNTALSDGDFATLAGSEALSNKTITSSTYNGTLGATTPSTVVATTVTATGLISGATNYTGFKNLLIDAGFTINQRGYVSAATLASGSYGHDRWKAGASGGDYTFTQLASSTTITIASGKSLIQVVEDTNVNGTSFVLSWTGTAQARYAVNSATPSGSYAASPILITGQTVGTTMSVEFNTGTLTNPQLELGSTVTSFDYRDYGRELIMCQRYFEKISVAGITGTGSGSDIAIGGVYKVEKRASPTLSLGSATNTDYNFFRSGAETANGGATIDNTLGSNTTNWITTIGGFTALIANTSWTGRKVAGIIYISAEL